MDCCWSASQTEWATDVMFRDPSALAALYPALVKQATHHFASPDVMRFLGRKVHGNFTGELTGSFKRRPEGVRVKHCLNGNSIKMYDKGGSVLRVAARIGYRLRILRAHGLIKKIPRSHRHRLTSKGQLLTAALSATRNATVKQLLRDAAEDLRAARGNREVVEQRA